VATLLDAGADELAHLGLPSAARRRVLAAAELARRHQPRTELPPSLGQPRHVLPHLAQLRTEPVELLGVLLLDTRHALLDDFQPVAGGHLMHVSITPREVFAQAVARLAAVIVLAHDHPSGDPSPSLQDREFTQSMVRAGALLGVRVLDHLIVTRRGYFSFSEAGLL
jgi:DNA repair protein RadC